MFTGIIQGLGEIIGVDSYSQDRRFRIKPLFKLTNIEDGESIAINGACLSVEFHATNFFQVYASAESLTKTTLASMHNGLKVNLERALTLGQSMGGHIVSGHVDCIAKVAQRKNIGKSVKFKIEFPPNFAPQIVPKGSVALDGISLTINDCSATWLEVNIIPDSQKRTNILSWQAGTRLNMETDIIGKYIAHLSAPYLQENKAEKKNLNSLLAQNGFLQF